MTVTPSKLTRAAALCAVLAGLLFIIIQPLHPEETVANVTTSTWKVVHYMTVAMGVFALVGLAGLYLRQAREVGWLGLIGYAVFSLEYLLVVAHSYAEALVVPPVAEDAPQFVASFVGILADSAGNYDLGPVGAIGVASYIMFVLGSVLFGVAVFRAGVLSRGAGALLAIGAAGTLLTPLFPHGLERWAAVPVGAALVWLGLSLWSNQRATVSLSSTESHAPRLEPAGYSA